MKTRSHSRRSSKRTGHKSKSQIFKDTSSIIERHSRSTKSRKKGITLTSEHPYHPENPNFERFETAYYIEHLTKNGASAKNILDYLDILGRNGINMGSNLHLLFRKEDLKKLASVVPRDYTSRNRLLKRIDASKTQYINDRLNTSHMRSVKDPMYGHTGTAAEIKNKTRKRKSRKSKTRKRKGRKSRRRKV